MFVLTSWLRLGRTASSCRTLPWPKVLSDAVPAGEHGPQNAAGAWEDMKTVAVDTEVEKRKAELRRARELLQQHVSAQDYDKAAVVQELIGALSSAVTRSAAAVAVEVDEGAKVERHDMAKCRLARDELNRCIAAKDYGAAAAAKEVLSACTMEEAKGGAKAGHQHGRSRTSSTLSSIETLTASLPLVCTPVRLEGVTFLCAGVLSGRVAGIDVNG